MSGLTVNTRRSAALHVSACVCVCVFVSPESLRVAFMKLPLNASFSRSRASGGSRGSTSGHISTDRSNRWRQTSGSSEPDLNAPVSETMSSQRETVRTAAGGTAAQSYAVKPATDTLTEIHFGLFFFWGESAGGGFLFCLIVSLLSFPLTTRSFRASLLFLHRGPFFHRRT